MTPKQQADIFGILDGAQDITIATVREDGYPQATMVSFVHDGLTIYFGCGPDSQKARNIKQCDKISLTVNLPYEGWDEIRGLSLGGLAFTTGLAEAMGKGITSWVPVPGTVSLTILFTASAIVLSEATSNTAVANVIVPIAIASSQAAGIRAIEPARGATLGASMGFMMPISTPPNAIVYSSGYISIGQMVRHGVLLDLVGFVAIVLIVMALAPLLF